ncbi:MULTISPECIES: hypothetical protein [Actinomycetes]|uniref:Integral membrane protein n=2 Tax=Actinomycetes TaxID=1760 RepID=A0ABP6M4C5_9MICC
MSSAPGVASLPAANGVARVLRGMLAAAVAIGSATAAHLTAGHHGPHPVILLLAIAVSVPVCVALARVPLSRWRLAAAVLVSQGVLHVLFALFPYSHASASLSVGQSSHPGHHRHHVDHLVLAEPSASAVSAHGVVPDAAMSVAHLSAGVLTYALLRRGEVLLQALVSLFGIRPVLMFVFRPLVLTGPRTMNWAASWPARQFSALWPGQGPWTLRGPPVVS